MALRQVHRCVSHQPYSVFEVPSQSAKNVFYEVHSIFPEDPPEDYVCTCQGFCYRGHCAHQRMAFEDRCLWHGLKGPEQQTHEQERDCVCPRCGGSTYIEAEVIDE